MFPRDLNLGKGNGNVTASPTNQTPINILSLILLLLLLIIVYYVLFINIFFIIYYDYYLYYYFGWLFGMDTKLNNVFNECNMFSLIRT
jgi:hypothetical protein